LSRKVKDLTELLDKHDDKIDDGMLSKKNFGPLHCASCDKNLSNILGKPVDFTVHKKMPAKDSSNERIARFG
jgi:hypothetical protein